MNGVSPNLMREIFAMKNLAVSNLKHTDQEIVFQDRIPFDF